MWAYLLIIFFSMLLITLSNMVFNSGYYVNEGLLSLIVVVCMAVVFAFIVDMIVSAIVMVLPSEIHKPLKKVYKWEKKFYNSIKIKAWKDYIPIGRGPIFIGMKKDSVYNPKDQSYLNKLIDECYRAEIMHLISMFAGFFILLILPREVMLSVSLPVGLVNMFLQYLPFIVQRYNIPKLEMLYERNSRYENQHSANDSIISLSK